MGQSGCIEVNRVTCVRGRVGQCGVGNPAGSGGGREGRFSGPDGACEHPLSAASILVGRSGESRRFYVLRAFQGACGCGSRA